MAGVRFDNVVKRYGDVVAVRDFTLDVEDGEFLAVVGPSGCGKSTTLRMIAGLEEISDGTITIGRSRGQRRPSEGPRYRDGLPELRALPAHDRVRQHGVRPQAAKGREGRDPPARRRGGGSPRIEELLERKPGQLSGGQRQRVALGRAIVREPSAFLLDEPLSNLDAKLRVQTRAEISKLHDRVGTTFFYVTHDQVEAMTMATRIAVMDAGTLQQVGTPQELYDRPDNIFVAGFIGSPSMNFFDATVRSENGQLRLDAGAVQVTLPEQYGPPLAAYADRAIVLGIRPEHVHDPAHVPEGTIPAAVRAKVEIAELMGNETFLHLTTGDHTFLARVDPRTSARLGEETQLMIDLSHLHTFDPETQQAVPLRDGA